MPFCAYMHVNITHTYTKTYISFPILAYPVQVHHVSQSPRPAGIIKCESKPFVDLYSHDSCNVPDRGGLFKSSLKDRLGDQRGGSEWEPIKILLQRENSAYAPNSQPRIPTRVCQGHVVTIDLPTLGTNAKQFQSGRTTQEAKDLAAPRGTRRTVRGDRADGPRVTDGQSEKESRPSSSAPQITDSPRPVFGRSASNCCRADGPRRPGGRSAKLLPTRNRWPNGSKRRHSRTRDEHEEPQANWLHAGCPRLPGGLSTRCKQMRE
jgi:hypothetical protein